MTAEIVQFPKKDGNGAREAMMEIMSKRIAWPIADWDAPAVTDYLLLSLYMAGFEVVPVKEEK